MEKAELHIVIKECLRNNTIHQKKLYVAFYDFAYGIALRYAGSREDALIIMNNGFYNVFVGLSKYDKTFEFKEWLKYLIILTAIEYLFSIKHQSAILREAKISDINPVTNNFGAGFPTMMGLKCCTNFHSVAGQFLTFLLLKVMNMKKLQQSSIFPLTLPNYF